MPNKYVKYGCEYKCGYGHKADIKAIQEHESTCWYNPTNKTCKTCRYEEYEHDEEIHSEMPSSPVEDLGYIRMCKHPSNINYTQAFPDELQPSGHIPPIVNCKNWSK